MATTKAVSKPPVKVVERASRYVKNVWLELKKVHWPTRREIITYTLVVLVSVFIVSMVIWILDSIFSFLLGFILK